MTTLSGPIQTRYGAAAAWTSNNPTLLAGEEGIESDTGLRKVGDGSTAWSDLEYQTTSTMGFVFFGSTAGTARPTGFGGVTWVGYEGTTPTNATANDIVVYREAPDVTAPATPTGLGAVAGDTEMTLNWDDNVEPDLDHYDYRVDGGSAVSTGLTSGALVTGLTNDVEYDFEVRAVDSSDNASAWSTAVSETPTASSSFNPLTQVTALHAFWADDPSWSNPGDGNPVASWRNESGGGDPAATSTERPLFRASVVAFNSRAAVEFDGINDALVFDINDVTTPYKTLTVARLTAASASKTVIGHGNNNAMGPVVANGASFWQYGSTTPNSTTVAIDTTTHVFRFRAGTTGSSYYIDEVDRSASANSGGTSMTELVLGCARLTSTNSRWAPAQIAFHGVYSAATDDADLATLAADLMDYYGL